MTSSTVYLIGYLVSFVFGIYVAGGVLRFRRNIRLASPFSARHAAVAAWQAFLWPTYTAVRVPSAQGVETVEAQQKARYERIQKAEDADEAYRLCLEFLQARPFELGAYASHVPYAEMLRQSVINAQADGPRMLHMIGLIALSQNDAKTTRRLLDRAVRADPYDAEIHNSLGFALCVDRKFLSASLVLTRAATLRPDLAVAEINLNLARAALSGGGT